MYTHRMTTAIPKTPDSQWILPARWLAISSMLVDHLARYLVPANPDYHWLAATLGRLAFPLFAAMLAWHLLFHTRNPWRYALRILLIGILTQPLYALMLQMPLTQPELNVCFTLAASLLPAALLKQVLLQSGGGLPNLHQILAGISLLLMALLVSPWVDYGLAGILLTPALVLLFFLLQQQQHPVLLLGSLLLVSFLGLGLNAYGLPTFSTLLGLCLIPLLASGTLDTSGMNRWLAPLPRWLWLGFYPGHLLLVVMLAGVFRH